MLIISMQLLNRNPKHRLGAHKDAADLKQHPFFKTIDWEALSLKQVTPPFKPVVESDESTANFDTEFTSADVRDVGYSEMDLDDDDPSEDWVSQSIRGDTFAHTPNGPLGSDKPINSFSSATGSLNAALSASSFASKSKGIQINTRKKKKDMSGTPLTSSVQENFRGFTYSGESLVTPVGVMHKNGVLRGEDDVVDDEEVPEVTTEDEFDDVGTSAGRYANARRRQGKDDLDGEMDP